MSFFEELKRRNVVKVGIAYLVAAWLLLQLTEVLTELLELNTDIGKIVIVLLLVGFIPALIFAWAFEMTPEGIKRDHEVDRSQSATRQTGRKLDFAVIAMLAMIAGYFIWEARFKAPDSSSSTPTSASLSPTSDGLIAAEETVEAAPNSIAVLPFANRSNQSDDLFFTDGIHDDLLTQLAKIDNLKVISRTSVMEYRGTTKKIPEIARELGVGRILEGGVQRAGDRVRINAQLIDVNTDEHLWAETFDREMTIDNIFDIQSEITRQIVSAVRGELSPEELRTLEEHPTDSLEAWEAFLHARSIIDEPSYGGEKYRRAEVWVERAVDLDPEFAEAWALLAEVQLQGIWIGYANSDEQRASARRSLDRAIALAPDNAAVINAQGDYAYRIELDYQRALSLHDQAIQRMPGNADLHHARGTTLRRLGRWDEAIAAYEDALKLDPLNGFAAGTMTETLWIMNDWARLEPLLERWLERQSGGAWFIDQNAHLLIDGRGDLEEAQRFLQSMPQTTYGDITSTQVYVALMNRDWDRAIQVLEPMERDHVSLPIFGRTRNLELGKIHSLKGAAETGKAYLETHIQELESQDPGSQIASAFRLLSLSQAQVWLGNPELGLELAQQASATLPLEEDHIFGGNLYRWETQALARAGEHDLALERLAEHLDGPAGFSRWELYLSPEWDFFRDNARFNELALPEGVEPDAFARPGAGS